MAREAPPDAELVLSRSLDVRYAGQAYELNVSYPGKLEAALRLFHAQHSTRYGHCDPNGPVEVVTARVRAIGRLKKPVQQRIPRGRASLRTAILGKRRKMTLYDREKLRAGHKFAGPALVVEAFATTWVPRDWGGTVDAEGNVLLRFRMT